MREVSRSFVLSDKSDVEFIGLQCLQGATTSHVTSNEILRQIIASTRQKRLFCTSLLWKNSHKPQPLDSLGTRGVISRRSPTKIGTAVPLFLGNSIRYWLRNTRHARSDGILPKVATLNLGGEG